MHVSVNLYPPFLIFRIIFKFPVRKQSFKFQGVDYKEFIIYRIPLTLVKMYPNEYIEYIFTEYLPVTHPGNLPPVAVLCSSGQVSVEVLFACLYLKAYEFTSVVSNNIYPSILYRSKTAKFHVCKTMENLQNAEITRIQGSHQILAREHKVRYNFFFETRNNKDL